MSAEQSHSALAVAFTVLVHVGVGYGVYEASRAEHVRIGERASESKLNHIEAGLAIKSKSFKGRKTKQPQKDVKRPVKPSDLLVAKNPDAQPSKKDPKKPDPADEVDPEAAMKRARELGEKTDQEPPAVGDPTGGDDSNQQGAADGSDFGRLDKAKGDPYVAELIGRMTVNPELEVPSTVPEGGLETWGCIRLDADGKIADAKLDPDHKSANAAFNSAVLARLKQTTDMESAVPDGLKSMLVEDYACFPYRY